MALVSLEVELTVVLGEARLPLSRLLRLGRGAIVALGSGPDDTVAILANGHPIARGRVSVDGATILVEVTELHRKPEVMREPLRTVGEALLGPAPRAAIAA